jgi:putative pyruvate formate lyase activating enzyme
MVGRYGSGTIFSSCNLLCVYCQNWQISHGGEGHLIINQALGRLMLQLQQMGCDNINLVTPTHFVANTVHALRTAVTGGLRIPLVYNCSGYEPQEVLSHLR